MNEAIQPCVSMRGEEGKAGSLKTQAEWLQWCMPGTPAFEGWRGDCDKFENPELKKKKVSLAYRHLLLIPALGVQSHPGPHSELNASLQHMTPQPKENI